MQNAEERLVEKPWIIPCGNAAIAGAEARTERVRRLIQTTGGEVEPDRAGGTFGEDPLAIDREIAFENRAIRSLAGRGNSTQQRHQFARQIGEKHLQIGGSRSRFVLVEQRIVRMVGVPDGLGFFALQRQDLLEPRAEQRELVFRPRFGPDFLRLRGNAGEFLDQPCGDFRRAIVTATQFPHVGRFERIGRCGHFRKPFADSWVGRFLMRNRCQDRHLIAAKTRPAARHVRLLIPLKHRRARVQ